MKNKFIIYALLDPRTTDIKYVGKSCYGLNSRYNSHLSFARKSGKKSKVSCWVRSLLNLNLKPTIIEIESFQSHKELIDAEIFYISYFNYLTNKFLLNSTDGGEGARGRKVSLETRKKMSDSSKGKKKSLEARMNMSKSKKGRRKKTKGLTFSYFEGNNDNSQEN